ncbi:tubulin-like doman-containing protein [Dysosmobacter sp.]|uniref:tubulin-like doman-containing protein n=1 Tax=Dysosmobacter sp. TaxID=2591382 RepID=UPI002A886193|nr:tubulin-like doman-containing protein [Dysosmobacter sp.]MDY3281636.1 tubulin-like doman-containing protein [Dysosmobacter sp.]
MAREILKDNVVTAPTLFIGVGGTGCRIIKGVAEMCKPSERENISFVCLDTNVNDLSSVKASGINIFSIQTSSTQTVGSYLDYDEDALVNWFPKNAVLYDKTVSEGAGQVRAISRLALNATIKTGRIQPLHDAVDELFRKTGKEMKQALRVAFASTASGGTGSGILLPLAMYLRDYVKSKYPNTSLLVRSLILLPETLDSVIRSNAEKESQRRNAYATIKEINAFMMKGSGFFDIDEELKRYSNLHIDFASPGTGELRALSVLPFDFCFLMDGQNAEDSTLINNKQYERQAALALYEQNIGPMQKDAFSMEDNIIKEMSSPGNYGRNRFGGIGAGAVRYPYEDVADYIAASWAIGAIGGTGEAAKWMKYDNAYEVYQRDCVKKGLASSEIDSRGSFYVDKMNKSGDNFSKDLRGQFLTDANARMTTYINALVEHVHQQVGQQRTIADARNGANALAGEIDYKGNSEMRGHAKENLDLLRAYEEAVNAHAEKAGQRTAEAVFTDETKTINAKEKYLLAWPLRNAFGDICHPNAIRYMLYLIAEEMEKRLKRAHSEISSLRERLEIYAPDADDADSFDVKFNGRKKKEHNLDELCAVEKAPDQNPNILEKFGGYEKLYDTLNEHFVGYYTGISELCDAIAEYEAFKFGYDYISRLNRNFEKFYRSFSDKVDKLDRKKDEIVEALRFQKGDSVFNVCSTRPMLDELLAATKGESSKGAMLESDLNGQIFDTVRANAAFEREMESAEVVLEDNRVDIFDEILLGYFKRKVRSECDVIDMNIIQAIAMENRLQTRIKNRENSDEKDSKNLVDNVRPEDNLRHIREVIAMGSRLSAPSIQRLNNVEPREINCIAYNAGLKDMREYRIESLVSNGVAVDTVSRYELHYFNALYNLTPDKLNKFACPRRTETRKRPAGLYHKAYHDYSKHIGPDSTKNMMCSTHIDKRWDSIAVMPELDFTFQNECIMHIYQALIYGLVHGAIKHVDMSASVSGKKIYRYENSEKRTEELIVSNGTLCDEFYEILDALYINSAVVEDIEVIKAKKRSRDETKNSNYVNTTFAKELETFCLDTVHEGKTSLFEIPLVYYNSLPNANRYGSEIMSLVDAVVKTFSDELHRWEQQDDAKFILCNVLRQQFEVLMENFKQYPELNANTRARNNVVVSTVFRKIKDVMCTTPEPDDFEKIIGEMERLMDD